MGLEGRYVDQGLSYAATVTIRCGDYRQGAAELHELFPSRTGSLPVSVPPPLASFWPSGANTILDRKAPGGCLWYVRRILRISFNQSNTRTDNTDIYMRVVRVLSLDS